MTEKICEKCQAKFIEDKSKWPIVMQTVGSRPDKPYCAPCMQQAFQNMICHITNLAEQSVGKYKDEMLNGRDINLRYEKGELVPFDPNFNTQTKTSRKMIAKIKIEA